MSSDKDLMAELECIAVEQYDGHFSVLRFTSNWRVCFYTPNTSMQDGSVSGMAVGKTFAEAAKAAIEYEAEDPGGWYERLSDAEDETEKRTRSQIKNPITGTWTKRDDKSGKFLDVKADPKPFKGVRKEKRK